MAQTESQRSWLDRLWSGIADQGRAFIRVPAAPGADRAPRLADALVSERGEASGAALARELVQCLTALPPDGRVDFLRDISARFSPEPARLEQAARAYLANPGPEEAAALHRAAEPPRQELLRRMNMAPGGTQALLGLRRDLLAHVKADPALRPLDHDLLHLFISWFNRGFLELRRIDWETPASVLERLIAYEAVHEIQGWPDLRRRLLPDRRCFAFFHPALPNEPLIFVEVALTHGLAAAIAPLLAQPEDPAGLPPANADTAIFYSISNCQDGLRGVSFGNFLIKQVVEELKAELPQLKFFATLSPVPGFRSWLRNHLDADGTEFPPEIGDHANFADVAAAPEFWSDRARADALRSPLMRLAAQYLTHNAAHEPADPVARFHLGNGARLQRIDWQGNQSRRGLEESFGIMVNYLYDPPTIAANHETFVRTGDVVRSAEVDALLVKPRRARSAIKAA